MVTFDRRYSSVRRGYSREFVKRDTAMSIERELSGPDLREAIDDDRSLASLMFRSTEDSFATRSGDDPEDAVPREATAPRETAAPPELPSGIEAAPPVPLRRSGPIQRALRWLFGWLRSS